MTAFVIPNAIQITTRQAKYTFTSFLSRDTTFDVMNNIWRLGRPEDNASLVSESGRRSLEGPSVSPPSVSNGDAPGAIVPAAVVKVPILKKATICACGREGKHYPETAMEAVIPGTPEKINTLLFASGFIKEFMSDNQKLLGAFFPLVLRRVVRLTSASRYPNVRLGSRLAGLEAAHAKHELH